MSMLASQVIKGDIRSIARLISLVENNDSTAIDPMKELHRFTGKAHVIGVTGVMGSGKSSLIYELAKTYRKQKKTVGIIAIDPSSPFSGGALLGDRIRMTDLSTNKGVFIRSMGTRGMLGGLTAAVYDVISILDAAGKDIILVETVGIGQDEIDIAKIADTTLVILVPGLGDSVQMIKAGLMEIADIFIVNKADKPGAEQTVAEIESLLDICEKSVRQTPIIKTSAKKKQGISDLIQEIQNHKEYLKTSKQYEMRKRKRYETELYELIRKRLMNYIYDETKLKDRIDNLIDQITKKKLDPHTAADEILHKILK
ncbi:MAG: methylmalonyl Co-A mutase-associated GTPase MeaB [Euryarchaeota archaeon]|nr:methylmalonyl Co-A mutase-associated GTPase MeaB [Euryarchaeota archaeon]